MRGDTWCLGGNHRRGGGASQPAATFIQDRWKLTKTGTMAVSAVQTGGNLITIPGGTNFAITRDILRTTLTTQQITLGATDSIQIWQTIEGCNWREICNDVHSVSLLVRSSVAGLKFSLSLND